MERDEGQSPRPSVRQSNREESKVTEASHFVVEGHGASSELQRNFFLCTDGRTSSVSSLTLMDDVNRAKRLERDELVSYGTKRIV